MIICGGNVREGVDGYYVSVKFKSNGGVYLGCFRVDVGGEQRRKFLKDWIADNCNQPAEIYGVNTIKFDAHEDAALFWLTFTKKNIANHQ